MSEIARVFAVAASLAWAVPAFSALVPLPLARTTGVGNTMVAYGPQVPNSTTIAALSQIVVASDSASIAAFHAANPSLCVVSYLNPNLAYYYPYYAEAQRTETAFLHASDPAYLGLSPSPTSVQLSWLPDARVALGSVHVNGYQVWRRTGASGPFQLLTTTAATATTFTDSGLATGGQYGYTIKTVDATYGAIAYSDTAQITLGSTTPAGIVCTGVTVTQPDSLSATTTIAVSASTSITGLDLWFDANRDRGFSSSERYAMQKGGNDPLGRQRWSTTVTTSEPKQLWGIAGHEWYVQTASGGGTVARCPADSFHSNNPNNRIRGYDWGPWLMNLADTTWTRILTNAAKAIMRTGADGMFIDVAVTSPQMLSPDASNTPRAIAAYPTDMRATLAAIKAAVAPAPVIFNGLCQAALPYTDVTDGGMTEGFAAQPWQPGSAIGGIWWGYAQDAELTAQATHDATILNVGLGYDAPISVRMYALGSHLLVANSRTFYYYARGVLAYYPEADIVIGSPLQSFARIADAKRPSGLYGRSFTGGLVLVNSSDSTTYTESLPLPMASVTPTGGSIPLLGGTGTLTASWVTSVTVPPKTSAILLNTWGGTVGIDEPPHSSARTSQFTVGPNPIRGSLELSTSLPREGRVRVMLYSATGRAIATLADERAPAGEWSRRLDMRSRAWPAGVYLIRLDSPAGVSTRRVVVVGSSPAGR